MFISSQIFKCVFKQLSCALINIETVLLVVIIPLLITELFILAKRFPPKCAYNTSGGGIITARKSSFSVMMIMSFWPLGDVAITHSVQTFKSHLKLADFFLSVLIPVYRPKLLFSVPMG